MPSHSHYMRGRKRQDRVTLKVGPAIRSMGVRWRCVAPGVALAIILGVSLALRLWGSGFGLPAYTRYHPDEHALVDRAAAILWTGDWNLHRFNYPPFYAYLQVAAYALYFLWGAAQGQWNQVLPFTLPQYYQAGRILTALVGTASVLVVYQAGRQIFRRRTGLLAAALLGGFYLHIIHSHYATFDIMVALLALLTLLFSDSLRNDPRHRWYLLAGLSAGLAGATKYNGVVACVVPIVAHILVTPWGRWGWLNGRLLVGMGGFLLGFFGGNPFALSSMPDFLTGLATVLHHYGTEQPGFEGSGNWRWYLRAFATSADAPPFIAGVAGLAGLVWRNWRTGVLVLAFPLTYFVVVSQFTVRFERNMVPIVPFLALGAAWLVERVSVWAAGRLKLGRSRENALAVLLVVLLVALPTLAAIMFDFNISRTDLREQAGGWLEENVEWGSKIALEHYSIPFDHSSYQVEDVLRISDHDLAWYSQQGFDVLVVSDGVWELLLKSPEVYGEKVAAYEGIAAAGVLLAEFVPRPPALVIAGYPTVSIYHFAPVRIFQVPH